MEIKEEQKNRIRYLCKRHNIRIMAVFGSAVGETSRDIDFALFPEIGSATDRINKLQLISDLEELFHKRADVVVVHSGTSTSLLYEICRNPLLLHEDEPGSFEQERSLAFRKYADTFKFRKHREKNIKNFVKGVDIVS